MPRTEIFFLYLWPLKVKNSLYHLVRSLKFSMCLFFSPESQLLKLNLCPSLKKKSILRLRCKTAKICNRRNHTLCLDHVKYKVHLSKSKEFLTSSVVLKVNSPSSSFRTLSGSLERIWKEFVGTGPQKVHDFVLGLQLKSGETCFIAWHILSASFWDRKLTQLVLKYNQLNCAPK